ncbi:HlyD family type I secretion periplasmic adaptor subunit [Devosia sp. CN2-171]|uniref:HlyD family type I secretion periplasmic adaptor subunit n=1 Tax=Devosia sp. CN2-171 TaxID=3400909 RepID=UPI003BF84CF7
MFESPTKIWQLTLAWWQGEIVPFIDQSWTAVRDMGLSPEGVATAGVTLCVLGLLFVMLGTRRRRPKPRVELARITRGPRLLGYIAAIALVGGFGTWAYGARLASAAIAPGVVSPDGYRKTIQHLEGGIVRTIHVREGDIVKAGDPLVTLDDTQALARRQELRARYIDLRALEARLLAEMLGHDAIVVPAELLVMPQADYARAVGDQRALFLSRRTSQSGRELILDQRIKQVEEQIAGLTEMIAAEDEQIDLLEQEAASVKKLYDKGLERLPRLLELQREAASVEAERAANRASIAQNRQLIGETQMQLLALRDEIAEKVSQDLSTVRSELAELSGLLASREDILARTIIAAPISGTVMHVRVTTVSGVLKSGEPILEIVPEASKLVIDARLRPVDIDAVHPGMSARVILTAYRQRNLPQIHGVLRSISADSLVDERSGGSYFLAKVEVDRASLDALGEGVRMLPGMPAEIMLMGDEQTLFEYLIAPVTASLDHSFRQ